MYVYCGIAVGRYFLIYGYLFERNDASSSQIQCYLSITVLVCAILATIVALRFYSTRLKLSSNVMLAAGVATYVTVAYKLILTVSSSRLLVLYVILGFTFSLWSIVLSYIYQAEARSQFVTVNIKKLISYVIFSSIVTIVPLLIIDKHYDNEIQMILTSSLTGSPSNVAPHAVMTQLNSIAEHSDNIQASFMTLIFFVYFAAYKKWLLKGS